MTCDDYSEFLPTQNTPVGFNSRFRAWHNAGQICPLFPVINIIIFNNEVFDCLGEYNPLNGQFVAAATGFYLLTGNVRVNTLPIGQQFFVWLFNWTTGIPLWYGLFFNAGGAGQVHSLTFSTVARLDAGDIALVRFSASIAGCVLANNQGEAHFSGHRLS